MAKQRLPRSDRQAFWEAYDHRCAYCDESIRWTDLVIDHIIPESLLEKPLKLASVQSEYGLGKDFDLRGDLNLVPVCARCNKEKSDRLYPQERTIIILGKASQHAARVVALRTRFQQEPKKERLLADLSGAFEIGAISKMELQQLFEACGRDEQPETRLEDIRDLKGAGVVDDPEVVRIFGNASQPLLGWPKETAGQWIERPALSELNAALETGRHSFTALLGDPGSGKSALLSRLGTDLAERGVALLAIKADLIPRDVDSAARLEEYLGTPAGLVSCVRQLAANRVIVLLIDQVDALTELMDQHPARLRVLLGLINQLRGIDDIHIVLSCREFEFRHDLRLASLKPHPVRLFDPPWEDVRLLLSTVGIDASNWPPEVRRLLCRPQHLNLFVRHLAVGNEVPAFRSYHTMLEAVLRERVLQQPWGPAAMRTLESLAGAMATEEDLWLPVARFQNEQAELDRLVATDLIAYSPDGLRIGFRHQTLFDFLRARAFTARYVHLAEYVLERQDALFVRPILWSTLHYFREADRKGYQREVRALWCRQKLRNHILYLLIGFLGQVPDPDPVECGWLLTLLGDSRLRSKVVRAIEGNPAWFEKMQLHLPGLMSGDDQAAWHASWVLQRAVNFSRSSALDLIERYWLPYSNRDHLTVQTLCQLKEWDERAVRAAEVAVRRTPDQGAFGRTIASIAAKSRPDLAPLILAAELWGALERAEASPIQVPDPPCDNAPDSEKITYRLVHGDAQWRAVEAIVSDASRWHDLGDLAEAAPRAFVEQIWPWLLHVLARYNRNGNENLQSYRRDPIFDLTGDERHMHQNLATVIEKAICGFARTAPIDFLAFADQHAGSDMLVVHRLLARGMKLVIPDHAQRVVAYLLADTRRFALGPYSDVHAESRELIAAAVPVIDTDARLTLERAILSWKYLRPDAHETADDRRHCLRWNREHRIRLLRAFPEALLSAQCAKLLREEERALPHTPDKEYGLEGGLIASSVSTAQMARASDANLLNLFDELDDSTGWHNPRDFLKGGSLEASRALGEFAKTNQERALQLLRKLQPGRHERYAAEALRGISEAEQPLLEPLIQAVHELAARGFASEEFRYSVAWALAKIAPKSNGLDNRTCTLLDGWLRDTKKGDAETITQPKDTDANRIRSILLEGGLRILPRGNYPVLHALFMGYFCRVPVGQDGWLSVLEQHLDRDEAPEVWEVLAQRELPYLAQANPERANELIARLLQRVPAVVNTEGLVRLVGRAHKWLRPATTHFCLANWEAGTWEDGPQAAAEVAMLRHALVPDDRRCQETIDGILAAEDSSDDRIKRRRCGLAFLCGELWDVPRARGIATRILLALLPSMDSSLAEAWLSVFNRSDHLLIDAYTEQLLDGITKHSLVLRYGHSGALVDRLKELLENGSENERVCRVVTKLLAECGQEIGDLRTAWALSGEDLVDIALTLQRSPETRSCGTDIFERLMDLDVYRASEALGELDRRFPA